MRPFTRPKHRTIGLLLLLAAPAHSANFSGLGHLPGDTSSTASAVSADGLVIVGNSGSPESEAFRWTESDGMVGLGFLPGSIQSGAGAVSGDGSYVVGVTIGAFSIRAAYLWTAETGMMTLSPLPGQMPGHTQGSASGISADGLVIAGWSADSEGFSTACRWTPAGTAIGLGASASYAYSVSADGSVIVGVRNVHGPPEAFRWTQAEGAIGLGDLPGGAFQSFAFGASADGSIIVGSGVDTFGRTQAFRWTEATGMVGLGFLPSAGGSEARAVSHDGSVIVGRAAGQAFVWDSAHGMRSLREVLVNYYRLAAQLENWTLDAASDVSANGRIIVGVGRNPDGHTEAWAARLPLPGDLNDDCQVDIQDLTLLLSHFGTPAGAAFPDGDLDADGDVDLADLSAFLANFGVSC